MKMKTKNKPEVIAIAAPTASGKTKYAIELAKKIDGEIISADSRIIYKGFNIACAKPTKEEMQDIKHYMIDIVNPEEDYNVANFYDDAKPIIENIINRGKTPIIAGGTGLYFRILLEDFDLPRVAPNFKLREELEKQSTEDLYNKLIKLDIQASEKIHKNNKIKIIRALEIIEELNKPHTEVLAKKEAEYNVKWIGLPMNREVLYKRIDKRVDLMVEQGLLEETKTLLKKHGRIKNFVKTIGYCEMLKYMDGIMSFEEAIEEIKKNTRHYAKRQLTWFRRNPALGY